MLRLRSYVNMNLGWSSFRVATLLLPANNPVMIILTVYMHHITHSLHAMYPIPVIRLSELVRPGDELVRIILDVITHQSFRFPAKLTVTTGLCQGPGESPDILTAYM